MVIRHTNRGHFRHFKVASRSLLRTLFLQDLVSCPSKDQREFGPQSGEREEEEEEDQAKETTQKAGTAKRRESSPLGTTGRPTDRPHTVDHI